jgi:hypothetical protein
MTALRCRPPGLGLDTVNATPVRPVLYALTLSLLANASGYAAGIRPLGGETAPGSDAAQKSQSVLAGGRARRDEPGRDAPIRSGDMTSRGAKDRASPDRNGIQPVALHGAGLAAKRSVNTSLGARSVLSKPAVAVARGYLPRRPAADNRAGPADPARAAARAVGSTSVGATSVGATSGSALAGRASSSVLLAAHRSATTFKPQAANGVIGGPRAAGPGSVGGPTNSKTVINASINGSALRHRS